MPFQSVNDRRIDAIVGTQTSMTWRNVGIADHQEEDRSGPGP